MERIKVNAIPGLSYLRLGWIVAHLPFEKENARGEMRQHGYKKAVLRALCDRYPNIWPSVDDLSDKASCCVRHVQDILQELERRDRLINNTTPIPPGIPVLSFEGPSIEDNRMSPIIRTVKKVGGASNTTPYAICDRKIVDWFIQRALAGEIAPGVEPSEEDKKAARKLM